jgi:hypothetical protein
LRLCCKYAVPKRPARYCEQKGDQFTGYFNSYVLASMSADERFVLES